MDFSQIEDFHTHNLAAQPGTAIVNIPYEWTLEPDLFCPREGVLYSAGLHPWWTDNTNAAERIMANLPRLLSCPQVVALGECGLDALRGAALDAQEALLKEQLLLAESFDVPVTLHIVRAFDRLLRLNKTVRHRQLWVVHGFRGKPALARQLLDAGFSLSFGKHFNAGAYAITPPARRFHESDDDF